MKTTLIIGITAATATAMFGVAGPASAFTFGTNGISFDSDQEVRFNFGSSNGAFQSTLKIFEVLTSGAVQSVDNGVVFEEVKASDNGSKKGYLGTLGNAVQMVNNTFTFLAGKVYTLGLVSTYNGKNVGNVYSTSSLNHAGLQRSVFGSTGGTEGIALQGANLLKAGNPFSGPVAIAFEDIKWASADGDFNDFAVTAEAVPEPLTMGGLALGAAGLAAARRSRKRRTTEA
ncbi:PEP-CTERM sorting domain-containing protein [Laspinema olomoucense]|uniref:PEP-CTERM sorting domain-containing protein n=1 Tax=Laspinema olomoucense TaxID=3231600 RepID=UPI0021BBAFB3|nr:PEP-CTERM sorting domain-containing protein [Laspinema sp. D3c]MCT7997137.1 PEP-CTERM sorting domain-containing protein [Laspinema sp. D3c]